MHGGNKKEQVSSLFVKIDFYRRVATDSRLGDLTVLMMKAPKKGPKLRSKAAEARGLIPFKAWRWPMSWWQGMKR